MPGPRKPQADRQQDRATGLLKQQGMVRASEFINAGITAATVSRMERKGELVQLSRGLYQLPDAPLEANHSLAEAAKLVPKGIICLSSALAFHGLTDSVPHFVWIALGFREWRPRVTQPKIQIVRFGPKVLNSGIETHLIESVPVRIYDPAKTIVDLFRHAHRARLWYGTSAGLTPALEGMKAALRLRKATPADIARYAEEAGVWKIVRPYLEAMTVNA
jgi:predicted transcriptional regulator of viral defense system